MKVHFTGLKGVGMTSLALAYQDRGFEIQGSDTQELQITDPILSSRHIAVAERFTPKNINTVIHSKRVPAIDELVYTAAHHGCQNVEPKWAMAHGISTKNYAHALGDFFSDKKQICVCGVGGKTTTTAMTATIFYRTGVHSSWVIGVPEIPSLPAPGRWDSEGEWAIIESDEYVADPSGDCVPKFSYLSPTVIICTSIEHDHPDAYPTIKETIAAYEQFFRKLPKGGLLLLSTQAEKMMQKHVPAFLSDLRSSKIQVRVYGNKEETEAVRRVIAIAGEHNIQDACAAVAAAEYAGILREHALTAIGTYKGAKRRFEFYGEYRGVRLYDDYAHHPEEIALLISTARALFKSGSRIRIIFHPHTYSRTKVFFDQFVQSFKGADEVMMVPIFSSAREKLPSAGEPTVSSEQMTKAIQVHGIHAVYMPAVQKLIQYLLQTVKPGDVIFTVGAGDIYKMYEQLIPKLVKGTKST